LPKGRIYKGYDGGISPAPDKNIDREHAKWVVTDAQARHGF